MARARRTIEATAFVAVWMAIGFAIPKDPNLYLVIGIPLTVAFQLGVRRRPIEDAWVRGGRPLPEWTKRAAVIFAALVAILAITTGVRGAVALWGVSAAVGVAGCTYSLTHATKQTMREALLCLATAGTIGVAVWVAIAVSSEPASQSAGARVANGVASLVGYIFVNFVLEEVTFRGVLDSHVHTAGDDGSIVSAVLVSALWGLWHVPLVSRPTVTDIGGLVAFQVVVGVPLSIFWRRSGNLFVPALTHAVLGAVRNALHA